MELVHQVRRFAVGKDGDGISKASVGDGERLGGDVDGTSFAVITVAGEGSTCGDGEDEGGGFGRSWMVCRSGCWGVS